MKSMKIACATTTAMTLLLLLLCCFRIGTTSAWLSSSSNAGSMARHRLISSGSKISFESTLLLGSRRHKSLWPPGICKAASCDIERSTMDEIIVNNYYNNSVANATQGFQQIQPSLSSNLEEKQLDEQKPEAQKFTYEQKFTNLVVLSIAFGYAFYTILSIDSGMTRGWSASEIAMRIPLDNWGAYESYLANKPIITKSLINVIIYLLGDWLSQTAFTKTNNLLEFDLQRTLRNGFIGLCFGPLVHEYYEFSDAILPPENGLLVRLQKIFMDQTIYLTVKCSLYITAVGLLAGEDKESVFQTVKDKIGGIVVTAWKFWPIVHCVTYSVIPAQHRVLWVNSVDLVWNAILSSAAQKDEAESVESEVIEKQTIEAATSGRNAVPAISTALTVEADALGGGKANTTNCTAAWVGI